MDNIETLSDKTRQKCGWMISFTWAELKSDLPFITEIMEKWTYHLINNDFDIQKSCPAANGYRRTFGELSSTGRSDWTLYANNLKDIYNEG